MTIQEIVEVCSGKLLQGNSKEVITTFSKDTREMVKGSLYIGFKGEHYNGNTFYQEAFKKGASACLLDDESFIDKTVSLSKSIILVDDSLEALHKLATHHLKKHPIPIVAVTGSVGKTSTKDMIANVLESKYRVLKTKGNYNGQIGLPLSVLTLATEEILVLEMGMNEKGQIKKLTDIVKPDMAIITNIGTSHIGNLGSKKNILRAKLEILEGLKEQGVLVLNNDDVLLKKYQNSKYQTIRYSIHHKSDYQANRIEMKEYISFDIVFEDMKENFIIPNLGEVYIYNALAAIIVGKYFNVPIKQIKKRLHKFSLSQNRMEIITTKNKITIINDVYNASYESVKNALTILGTYQHRKIAVLGDMLELGKYAKEFHQKIGDEVIKQNIDILVTVGRTSKYINEKVKKKKTSIEVYHYEELKDVDQKIISILQPTDTILLKASNGMNFSLLKDQLKTYYIK